MTITRRTTTTNSGTSVDWANVDFSAMFGVETAIANSINTAGITKNILKNKFTISPTTFFKFTKSKLSKIEQKDFKERVTRLISMLNYSKSMNQLAVYDDCSLKLTSIFQEQELLVVGIDRYLYEKSIIQYLRNVQDKVVKFKEFTEFPRIVPKHVRNIYSSLRKKNIFDEYWILYIDHHDEVKSNKQKIKEKDPILFGKLKVEPTKLYFIADWVDEYCDLTLDQLTNSLEKLDNDYKIEMIDEINHRDILKIKDEMLLKQKRLANAHSGNYRDLMKKEDIKPKTIWKLLNFFRK